jgi:Domain of unknown function (DUF4386)
VISFAASIPAVFLLAPVLNHAGYIVSPGADMRVLWGCFLDLVNALACIGTAVALFPVVRRQNEAAALGFVTSRMLEAAIIVIGVVSLLAVVTLRQDLADAPGTDTASLVTTGRELVAVRDWTFLLGPGLTLPRQPPGPGPGGDRDRPDLRVGAVAWPLAGHQGLQAVPPHRRHCLAGGEGANGGRARGR